MNLSRACWKFVPSTFRFTCWKLTKAADWEKNRSRAAAATVPHAIPSDDAMAEFYESALRAPR